MNTLKVLDVTLRDGGCVNDFNFGQDYMHRILAAQEASGVDIIELGYIDDKKGSEQGRTQYINEQVISRCILRRKKPGTVYVAMMDYGKFDPRNLHTRTENDIDGIRVAFHKKDMMNIPALSREIISRGYDLYLQPMITLRYSDSELLGLISMVNCELADISGFYIVDSFGEMRPNDMNRMMNLVDHNLDPAITLGFHSHNNLQMSYSNACSMLSFPTNRNIILDSSIMGMGKGAGNLNTELLLEHLNLFYGKSYNIPPLLEVIDSVINQIREEFHWGYGVEYYLSSVNHCTPSYASHFYNKHMLPIDRVGELLGMIDESKKISFDREYAEKLYREYNDAVKVDDTMTVEELRREFAGKKILLCAPGKSLSEAMTIVCEFCTRDDVVSLSLNTSLVPGIDYVFAGRPDIFADALACGRRIIAPSSVREASESPHERVKVLNYRRWIETDSSTHDTSFVIVMNMLKFCGVREVFMAGFDGFSMNINDNYLDPNMRRPINATEAEQRNSWNRDFVRRIRESGMKIHFLTPSVYDE